MNSHAELGEMPSVIARFAGRLQTAVRRIFAIVREELWPELTPRLLIGFAADVARTRSQLLAENAFLRQQLIVANRSVKRPNLRRHERGLLALLASVVPDWGLDHMIMVGVRHFQSVLGEYAAFFNDARPHQGLLQSVPMGITQTELAVRFIYSWD